MLPASDPDELLLGDCVEELDEPEAEEETVIVVIGVNETVVVE